ncbi:MAG: hypothetical protein C5B51_17820 [Terriglobia bacterium]|nr:MAG: hypothetical protein C5B51_17820 [Terriglobia bacterium]
MSLTPFTADQLKAVDPGARHLDTCVVAGPGSGKTTVLVEYFSRLVAAGVDPLRILTITFTEKAAGNMRKKLAEAFHHDTQLRARLERAWVSTVHGFCTRLLKENAIFAGVDPAFAVADERESWRLQNESIDAAVTELFAKKPSDFRALIRGLSSITFEEACLSAYDAMRGAGLTIDRLAAIAIPAGADLGDAARILRQLQAVSPAGWNPSQRHHLESICRDAERIVAAEDPLQALHAIVSYSGNLNRCKRDTPAYELVKELRDLLKELPYSLISDLYQRERGLLLELLRRFDHVYRERKTSMGLLDFADLEEYTVRLLDENADARARLRAQFDHILMDEFQDTNGQQAKLLELIRRDDRFYAVGDINQSIFGFRHAEPEVFRAFRDRVRGNGRRLIELFANFRSRPEILRAVETITDGAAGVEPQPLEASRQFSAARPVCVDVICAPELTVEARWVAHRILELIEGSESRFHFKDVAVLVRNTEVMEDFSRAFADFGIPYVVNRGKGFYEGRDVKDLCHLLRIIANPTDEISMAVVLRSPLVGASDEALLRLKAQGENLGTSLMRLGSTTAEVASDDHARLIDFRDRLREWRVRRESVSFDRPLLAALDGCGYQTDARGWANIEKFLAQAREASGRMSLDEFVDHLALLRGDNLRERDAPPEDSTDAVSMMTIHSAKGLEFPIVCVAALHKGIESNPPVVAFSRRYGLGASWRNPATGEEKDDLVQHAIREERKVRETQEGERLLYVAMTRAEEHLVLSFSGQKQTNWAKIVQKKLRLDPEIPREEVLTRVSPRGEEWKFRLKVADRAPELMRARAENGATATEVEWLAAPSVSEQQDANATVTAVAAFAKCPREYYLGHYLGYEGRPRRLEDAGEPSAGEFGTLVHRLLAGAEAGDADPKAQAMAEVFRQSALGKRAERASRVEREFDFLMALDGLVLRGQIDLWFEDGGETVIVDYKTDTVTAVEAHQRAQDYAMQLRLYALAVERLTGRPPDRAWLHFLRPNTAIEVDLTPSLLDSPEQIVRDFQEAQEQQHFPLREGAHCRRCPFFRDLCPAGTTPTA